MNGDATNDRPESATRDLGKTYTELQAATAEVNRWLEHVTLDCVPPAAVFDTDAQLCEAVTILNDNAKSLAKEIKALKANYSSLGIRKVDSVIATEIIETDE